MFKKIDWTEILITAVVAILAVKVVYPLVQPTLAKVPFVGNYFTA